MGPDSIYAKYSASALWCWKNAHQPTGLGHSGPVNTLLYMHGLKARNDSQLVNWLWWQHHCQIFVGCLIHLNPRGLNARSHGYFDTYNCITDIIKSIICLFHTTVMGDHPLALISCMLPRSVPYKSGWGPARAEVCFGPSSCRLVQELLSSLRWSVFRPPFLFSCPYSMPAQVPQRAVNGHSRMELRPPTAPGSERGQKWGQNEARTRPENSFGNPSALAAVYHQPGSKSLAGV